MVTNTLKFEVQLRGGFSDRNGIKVENCALQSTEFDSRTRTAIINATRVIINALQNSNLSYYQSFLKNTLSEVYRIDSEKAKSQNETKLWGKSICIFPCAD